MSANSASSAEGKPQNSPLQPQLPMPRFSTRHGHKRQKITPTTKLPLDTLPADILDIIFSHLPVESFVQLLSHDAFLAHNPSMAISMARRLASAHIFYTNRTWQYSFIEMYMLTPSPNYLDKSRLEQLDNLQHVVDLLKFNAQFVVKSSHHASMPPPSPQFPLTMSYYIWNLLDLFELFQVLTKTLSSISQTSGVAPNYRFNIELEFDPGILNVINLGQILADLSPQLSNSLAQLSITNFTGDFAFDVSRYPQLQKLRLENTNVKFKSSFRSNRVLDTLILHPNCNGYNNNKPIVLNKSLPVNLQALKLGNCIINPRSLQYPIPSSLQQITLSRVKDNSNQYLINLLDTNTKHSSHLQHLSVETLLGSDNQSIPYFDCLHSAKLLTYLQQHTSHLTSLFISNVQSVGDLGIWDFQITLPNLQLLQFSQSLIRSLKLPSSLRKLLLSNNNIKHISETILPGLPAGLKHLNIADNPIDWDHEVAPIKFPPHLTLLKLSNTGIGENLYKLQFPDSIELLSLEVNQLTSVDNIHFPRSLINLGIGSNRISTVGKRKLDVPSTVHTIHMTENKLSGPLDLSETANLDGKFNLQVLYLNYNYIHSLQQVRFPSNLKLLNFDNCAISELANVCFPASIVELSFNGCNIRYLKNISFETGSRLVYLNLAHNKLVESSLSGINDWPQHLQTLNLSYNLFESYVSKSSEWLECLPRIRYLNMANNKVKELDITISRSLECFDLSMNSIRSLQLRFAGCEPHHNDDIAENCSNLKVVNLSQNKLAGFNVSMLGHGVGYDGCGPMYHDLLLELDLTENKLKPEDIKEQIDRGEYPKSLKSLLIGNTGEQDQYGYDIGRNIIESNYCLGKKIDMPYS